VFAACCSDDQRTRLVIEVGAYQHAAFSIRRIPHATLSNASSTSSTRNQRCKDSSAVYSDCRSRVRSSARCSEELLRFHFCCDIALIDHHRAHHGIVEKVRPNGLHQSPGRILVLLIDQVVVTDDAVEIRYVIPTAEASRHTRFCQLRTDKGFIRHVFDRAQRMVQSNELGTNIAMSTAASSISGRTVMGSNLPTTRQLCGKTRRALLSRYWRLRLHHRSTNG
jgi:hypothetical protein